MRLAPCLGEGDAGIDSHDAVGLAGGRKRKASREACPGDKGRQGAGRGSVGGGTSERNACARNVACARGVVSYLHDVVNRVSAYNGRLVLQKVQAEIVARTPPRGLMRVCRTLGDEWQTVQGALSGAERIFEALSLPADEQLPSSPQRQRRDGLVCEDVVFGYLPGVPVLRGVTLRVVPGEYVALVGRTGAGKTSIVHLLAGLYEPWRGTVRVAGHSPRALSDEERRQALCIVPQALQLFSGTVLENLTLKDESVPESAVIEAAKIGGAGCRRHWCRPGLWLTPPPGYFR